MDSIKDVRKDKELLKEISLLVSNDLISADKNNNRNLNMVKDFTEGLSVKEIAIKNGISYTRCNQIITNLLKKYTESNKVDPKSIQSLNLSQRIKNALLRKGISTVDELRALCLDTHSLTMIRGIGRDGRFEIYKSLNMLPSEPNGLTDDIKGLFVVYDEGLDVYLKEKSKEWGSLEEARIFKSFSSANFYCLESRDACLVVKKVKLVIDEI